MKSYIPHRILIINDQVTHTAMNETVFYCYRLAFDWSNRMGIEGKRVFDLFLEKPKYDADPLNIPLYSIWCKIECTIEERERWDEMQKLNLKQEVYE